MGDIAFTIIYVSIVAFIFMMIIKTDVTYRNQMLILNAIRAYMTDAMACEEFEWSVCVLDMESFDKTLWRLWDWGYKNILPKEKFEIVERYIKRGRPNDQT